MKDLVTRQSVLTMLNKIENAVEDGDGFQFNKWIYYAKDMPSAEKTAEWIIYGKQGGIPISYRCSNCDFGWENNKFKYCPECGRRMKGESDGKTKIQS